jgi:hypothetical protein
MFWRLDHLRVAAPKFHPLEGLVGPQSIKRFFFTL